MNRRLWTRVVLVVLTGALIGCTEIRRALVSLFSFQEATEDTGLAAGQMQPSFDGKDARRKRLAVRLVEVARGFEQTTDVQAIPDQPDHFLILEKEGGAWRVQISNGSREKLFHVAVQTVSEQGLLGAAFHPQFEKNRRFFLNYIPKKEPDVTRIAEWIWPKGGKPRESKVLLEVPQPYQNHNAGQIAFGPDGYLHIGLGDGGWRADPEEHGQNPKTLPGSMLRIDVDRAEGGKAYAIPKDNPFAKGGNGLPEVFAYGLRNPWRFSFDARGRIVSGDVGQDLFEELTFIGRGDNLGWNVYEGFACFKPKKDCDKARPGTYAPPILQYGREDGNSITSGFEVTAPDAGALRDHYLFGDFGSGRLWAVKLPQDRKRRLDMDRDVLSLGRWPLQIATFGRDLAGRVYVANFQPGILYRIEAKASGAP